jgi:hypothetical protein
MIGLRGVVAHGDGLVIMRVEWLSEALFGFDTVATQELGELLEGHFHALSKLFRRGRDVATERAFKVVNDRQQFADESFLLCHRTSLCLPRGSLAEIVEVGGQAQVAVLLGS